jgi:hypothetical protein
MELVSPMDIIYFQKKRRFGELVVHAAAVFDDTGVGMYRVSLPTSSKRHVVVLIHRSESTIN